MKCTHCNIEWQSKSSRLWITCPNCMLKTKNINSMFVVNERDTSTFVAEKALREYKQEKKSRFTDDKWLEYYNEYKTQYPTINDFDKDKKQQPMQTLEQFKAENEDN